MTISSQVRSAGPYVGSGTQTVYPFSFKVFQASDVLVLQADLSLVQTTLALGSAYTVTLNVDQNASPGGTVNLISALVSGYKLTITSNVPVTQVASLTNAGGFFPKTIEDALDRLVILMQQYGITNIGQALRVPEIGGVATLPAAGARANYLLGFDGSGNPITVAPASGSAASLAADLANAVGITKGAGMVALGLTQAYGANTLGAFARQLNPLRKYGTLNNDGITDDSAVFIAAAASGDLFIDARGLNCRVQGQVNIPANQTWLLAGSNLSMTGTTNQMFVATNVDNWALIGPFKITGDGSTVGTAKGVRVTGCNNWRVDNLTAYTIKGWGFYLEPGAGANRTNHGNVLNFRADTCYRGWEDIAGTGAEYTTLLAPTMRNCVDAGMISSAGNLIVIGGHIVENQLDGLRIANGANGNHGMFIGTHINHNIQYNLMATQVVNGHTFSGCHFYANDGTGTAAIWLDRCKGINISGGHLDCQVYNYKDGSSGVNIIENMYCPGGYGVGRRAGTNDGHDQLIIRGCFGPGAVDINHANQALNDPAEIYVLADRAAASTQSLTSATPATLIFPTNATFPDRRLVWNQGTGIFTAPKAGLYEVKFDVIFGGTGLTNVSYVALYKNAGLFKFFFLSPFTTTKLTASGVTALYLAAGDTLSLQASITGTTPIFGDASASSNISFRLLA